MNMWEAIVVIVVVTSFAKVLRARYYSDAGYIGGRHGEPVPLAKPADDSLAREAQALRQEVIEMRERIKVLERIVVDNRHADTLAGDIESLR